MAFTYAVGDIHGRYDLLINALRAIDDHAAAHGESVRLVFLGDYVDRGPQSREVISRLMALGDSAVCLKGNHEAAMLLGLSDGHRESYRFWMEIGGDATLRSYGDVNNPQLVPGAHFAWLVNLPLIFRDDHRIYVHAGVLPGMRVADQGEGALLWVRERFLRAEAGDFSDGKHIVHGHTPHWSGKPEPTQPELLPHRTNLDTGAYMTGVLTVGVFHDQRAGGPGQVLRVEADRVRILKPRHESLGCWGSEPLNPS